MRVVVVVVGGGGGGVGLILILFDILCIIFLFLDTEMPSLGCSRTFVIMLLAICKHVVNYA